MKKLVYICVIVLGCACSSIKKLEATAPFSLGEPYAQKWQVEEEPFEKGYEVVIPIISLETEKAEIKNLYHHGMRTPLSIELTSEGNVMVAEYQNAFPSVATNEEEEFPFELKDTQAVISYVSNDKVRYYQINGIRQNLVKNYPSTEAKNNR